MKQRNTHTSLRQREVPPTPWRNLIFDVKGIFATGYGYEKGGSAKSWGTPPSWQTDRFNGLLTVSFGLISYADG